MTFVRGSAPSAGRRSDSSRSALLPMLISLARPRWRPAAQSRIAVPSAPDWESTEIPPGRGICAAKDAFMRWWVSIRPRQFGPSIRTPRARHRAAISASSAAPSSPTSLKPAVMTMIALAPASMDDSTAERTNGVATAMTARSTSTSASRTSLTQGSPSTSSERGFTGTTRPSNPPRRRFETTS